MHRRTTARRSSSNRPSLREFGLGDAGVSTVIWTTGYRLGFDWIDLPIFDEQGFPRQRRGVTDLPGLYFLGLLWQHTQASATLFGVGLDARHIAGQMRLPIREETLELSSDSGSR
jgi:putative flavoprotein involved in K+ transport